MGKNQGSGSKPETKAQRTARRDAAFRCSDCTASYATADALGFHTGGAHTPKGGK